MVKRMLVLFCVLMSCSQSRQERIVLEQDTVQVNMLKREIYLIRQLDSILPINAELKERVTRQKMNAMGMIDMTLNYKEFQIKTVYIQQQLDSVIVQKDNIIKELVSIRVREEELIRENEGYHYKLESERQSNIVLMKEKVRLEETLEQVSRFGIIGVTVTGIGHSTNLFGKTREIEINKADKIKKIRVSFMFTSNAVAKKEAKYISVIIYNGNKKDFIKKDTIVNYVGGESFIKLFLTSDKEFKIGSHLVNVIINDRIEYEKEFRIIK